MQLKNWKIIPFDLTIKEILIINTCFFLLIIISFFNILI
jgi:hypothetical protein